MNQIRSITRPFSDIVERWQKIAEPILVLSERLSLNFRSISEIGFKPCRKIPEKPVIEPHVLFRDSEQDVCNRLFALKTETHNVARQRVEYQRLIEDDVNWGISLWLMSRYGTAKTRKTKKKHLGIRAPQWLRRPTLGEAMWTIQVLIDIASLAIGLSPSCAVIILPIPVLTDRLTIC